MISLLRLASFFTIFSLNAKEISDIIFRTPEMVIHHLIATSYHKKPSLKIAHLFDVDDEFFAGIQREALLIATKEKTYSLLNTSGFFDDHTLDTTNSLLGPNFQRKHFHMPQTYPNLARFISLFPHATNFRLMPSLPQPEDMCIRHYITEKPALKVRFCLPINGNGSIYFIHTAYRHTLKNGPYLIWDMLLTKDTYKRMFKRKVIGKEFTKIKKIAAKQKTSRGLITQFYPIEIAQKITLCEPQ